MQRQRSPAFAIVIALAVGWTGLAEAQRPLGTVSASGETVTPVFEGWYQNPDGTYSVSFGYYNRNREETMEIPIGPNNFIEPGELNQGQPTHFQPRRHWGVFVVRVPADFGDQSVVWTLKNRGKTFSIPGSLRRDWKIDALEGEAGSGNTPPVIRFEEHGPAAQAPGGITSGPLSTSVEHALTLTVWASDDGRPSGSVARAGREDAPVKLTWFKHQGPGEVTFSDGQLEVPSAGGSATTTVTFSEPGEYILRVRANDASGVTGAGHAQCCWTNGFVKVTVTPQVRHR